MSMSKLGNLGRGTILTIGICTAVAVGQVRVDKELPTYTPVSGVSGTIVGVGSDTMNNLMALWAEGFRQHYPNVRIEIEGKGSSTAPPALIAGSANFGPMSREMKPAEIDEFVRRFGYPPVALKAAVDMLAVYVHRDNPILSLTLEQVDAIFSKHRWRGAKHNARVWGDLGVAGALAELPIGMYGRNAASGTYTYFKETALVNGDFKDAVKEQPGSSSVVQSISNDRCGIGYSGIGYQTASVKAVAIGGPAGSLTPRPANAGRYPMSRYLLVYLNRNPKAPLDPLRREFVRFIFSRQGQLAVVKDGYLPVDRATAGAALTAAGIYDAGRSR